MNSQFHTDGGAIVDMTEGNKWLKGKDKTVRIIEGTRRVGKDLGSGEKGKKSVLR